MTGSAPFDHPPEFIPVDLTKVIVAAVGVPSKVGIGQLQTQVVCLRYRNINKALAQFIIALTLDLPGSGGLGMRGIAVVRSEHHQ